MVKVAILDDYQGVALQSADWSPLSGRAEVVALREHLPPAELGRALRGVEVVVAMRERTPFPDSTLALLPDMKLLITTGPRNRSIDMDACRARGITVCHTGSQSLVAVEIAWALILGAAKHLVSQEQSIRAGHWQTAVPDSLCGRTLGLMGVGKLGTQMAVIGRAFGMELIAWSPNLTQERAEAAGVRLVDKRTLFAESDYVSVHMALAPSTRGLVDAASIAAMKSDAWLVNTSRAGLVDEAALIRALEAGSIAGAALDVFEPEPLPAGAPILKAPRTLLSPHLGYVSRQNYAIYFRDIVENIQGWLDGKPLRVLA